MVKCTIQSLYFKDAPLPHNVAQYASRLAGSPWRAKTVLALSKVIVAVQDETLLPRFDREGPDNISVEITCALHMAAGGEVEKWAPVRIYGDHLPIRMPKDVQGLEWLERGVCVKGVVIRSGPTKMRVRRFAFRCGKCTTLVRPEPSQGEVFDYPAACSRAKCKSQRFEVAYECCTYEDWQQIHIQQDWKGSAADRSTLLVNLWSADAGLGEAGDRVKIYGTVRQSFMGNSRVDAFASYALDAYRIEGCSQVVSVMTPGSAVNFTSRHLTFMKEIGTDAMRFPLICASICPDIIGRPLLKAGLMLSLLGGKTAAIGRRTDQIHLLMCGDPGLGKSRLLKTIAALSEEGIFFSGAAATTAGLTAAVIHQDHDVVLEAGALPLADQGVCCIDEFDKMPKVHQDGLLEAMEQQTVTVAKAGIVSQLSARATVICACNPKNQGSDFLSKALVSRFDLIFYLKDDVSTDKLIAQHYLQSAPDGPSAPDDTLPARIHNAARGTLPEELLKVYTRYARHNVRTPTLTPEAKQLLKELYAERRRKDPGCTFRHFESLIRLSEARAKGDLSSKVTWRHVMDVADIFDAAESPVAMPVGKRARPGTMRALVQALERHASSEFTRQELEQMAIGVGFTPSGAENAVEKLHHNGGLLQTATGFRVL